MSKENKKFFTKGHRNRLIGILCFLVIYISAHSALQPQQKAPLQTNQRLIKLIKAQEMTRREASDVQILLDSVVLFHDGAYMYCDSAYLDEANNSFEAFSRVRVEQGDTLFLFGDYVHYDGNLKIFKARHNVRLENWNIPKSKAPISKPKDPTAKKLQIVTLFTDSLNYDRMLNIGYYFNGGMLVDEENELTSYWGQYEPAIKIATFSDSVKLENLKFELFSDTLKYNTNNKVATILGPSTIVSDSGTIHTTKGWYNTQTEQTMLLSRSSIVNKQGDRILIGDSIAYNKAAGYGEVFGNMFLQDTTKKIILRGHYGFYNERTEYAMATDSAWAIEYSQPDSLYISGDTLKMISDSVDREIKAYYGVRIYRNDIQGVCDSLQFNTKDSTLYMYIDPVVWNEKHQLSGDTIEMLMNDSTIDLVHVKQYCFAIEQKDSTRFNQLKGRDLKAYFEGKGVRYIIVEGNAESIFYPEEKDGTLIGMNHSQSSYLSITIKEKKMEKLKLWPKVTGRMTPLSQIKPAEATLKDFEWYDYMRPLNKDDIFRKVKKKPANTQPRFTPKFIEGLDSGE